SSIEYYLENLDQGNRIRENLISEVGRQIDTLQQQVSQDDRAVETIEETDLAEQEKSAETDIKDDEQSIDAQEDDTQSEDSSTPDVNDQVQAAEADQSDNKENDGKIVTFGDDADDFIKEVFVEEFEEELPNLQSEHQAWQEDPENNEQSLTEVRRIFHTLKGSGRLVGAEVIGEFGWKLENMCNRALDGAITYNDNFKSVLDSGIDLAQELLTALKERAAVPAAYPVVLQNADNVAD